MRTKITTTKDEVSITTKADFTHNTDKLVDLLHERTAFLKDDQIWKTMSISAGIDAILLFHIYQTASQQKTSKKSRNNTSNE